MDKTFSLILNFKSGGDICILQIDGSFETGLSLLPGNSCLAKGIRRRDKVFFSLLKIL